MSAKIQFNDVIVVEPIGIISIGRDESSKTFGVERSASAAASATTTAKYAN